MIIQIFNQDGKKQTQWNHQIYDVRSEENRGALAAHWKVWFPSSGNAFSSIGRESKQFKWKRLKIYRKLKTDDTLFNEGNLRNMILIQSRGCSLKANFSCSGQNISGKCNFAIILHFPIPLASWNISQKQTPSQKTLSTCLVEESNHCC